jgi:hypothetical protein
MKRSDISINYRHIKNPYIRSKKVSSLSSLSSYNPNNYINSRIISGEKYQDLADTFLGLPNDFKVNPFFYSYNKNKQYDLSKIGINGQNYENSSVIFCFSHRINILSQKIKYFKNRFVLITHNSDYDIKSNSHVDEILNSDKLIKWYAQNLCIEHEKIHFLPIGIANMQWKHGRDFYNYMVNDENRENDQKSEKTKSVYMCFTIGTNESKRRTCYNKLFKKIPFLQPIDSVKNIERMKAYKYCICPDGNGIDTHRFWESIYLKIVPIVLRNPLNTILEKYTDIPMIILDSWDNFDIYNIDSIYKINYEKYNFASKFLDMNFYKELINERES